MKTGLRAVVVACVLQAWSGASPRAVAADVALQRGETAVFAVEIVNRSAAETGAVFRSEPFDFGARGGYVVTPIGSECRILGGELGGSGSPPVELHVSPVPAGSRVRCTLQVRRAELSSGVAWLRFEADADQPEVELLDTEWTFGSLTNLSFHSEQVAPFPAPGESTGMVRITIANQGPWAIERVSFGACQTFALAPFLLEGNFPGGCEESNGQTCLAVGPGSITFGVHSLAPGETRSCLLRATSYEPLEQPLRFGMELVTEWGLWSGDELIYDYDRSDNDFVIELAPRDATAAAPVAVPAASGFLLGLLGILLASMAACVRRGPGWCRRAHFAQSELSALDERRRDESNRTLGARVRNSRWKRATR